MRRCEELVEDLQGEENRYSVFKQIELFSSFRIQFHSAAMLFTVEK